MGAVTLNEPFLMPPRLIDNTNEVLRRKNMNISKFIVAGLGIGSVAEIFRWRSLAFSQFCIEVSCTVKNAYDADRIRALNIDDHESREALDAKGCFERSPCSTANCLGFGVSEARA